MQQVNILSQITSPIVHCKNFLAKTASFTASGQTSLKTSHLEPSHTCSLMPRLTVRAYQKNKLSLMGKSSNTQCRLITSNLRPRIWIPVHLWNRIFWGKIRPWKPHRRTRTLPSHWTLDTNQSHPQNQKSFHHEQPTQHFNRSINYNRTCQ